MVRLKLAFLIPAILFALGIFIGFLIGYGMKRKITFEDVMELKNSIDAFCFSQGYNMGGYLFFNETSLYARCVNNTWWHRDFRIEEVEKR